RALLSRAGMACLDSDSCLEPGMCLIKYGEASVLASQAGGAPGRVKGERPFPDQPEGANCLAQIDHILVLMMENHSYDNYLGMLGRRGGEQPRGDGFTLGADGLPTAANPAPDGSIQHAFRMPTTCQLSGKPSQEWEQAHNQFNGGRNDGFVKSDSGPVAMGYWTGKDLPWAYSLATTFPVADRWFAPILGQTQPNRRYPPAHPPLPAGRHLGRHGRRPPSGARRPSSRRDDLRPPGRPPDPMAQLLLQLPPHQLCVPRYGDRGTFEHRQDRPVLRRCQNGEPSRIRDHRPRFRPEFWGEPAKHRARRGLRRLRRAGRHGIACLAANAAGVD